ncbi:hypothetical protein [Mastigocoleus testarum]|nr:hypothetical protein [Mastigocoleus testarum]
MKRCSAWKKTSDNFVLTAWKFLEHLGQQLPSLYENISTAVYFAQRKGN